MNNKIRLMDYFREQGITVNQCDYGHETIAEVRLLPTGGGGNIIICYPHYLKELREFVRRFPGDTFPRWETLSIYDPNE